MTKLVLHIGTEKTGTTSIQNFLKRNIDQLKRNGVYVPQTPMLWDGNHRWIPLLANNNGFSDDFVVSLNFNDEEDRRQKISKKRKQFIDECQSAKITCNTIVLSSEHIHSRLKTPQEIERLQNLVKEFAHEIVVVIYIRDPLKTAVSLLSTAIKFGSTSRTLPSPSAEYFNYICNHGQTISLWEECFPGAKIAVRKFDRSCLAKGDVVMDFCSQFIDDFCEEDYEFPKPANETLSLTGMALLRKLNERFPCILDNKINPVRGTIKDFVMNNTLDGSKFLPCREEFEAYKNHFSESCERVRSHYFPLEESLFIEQNEFARDKIDLKEVEIDPHVLQKMVESLWIQKRNLELRLKDAR